MATISEVAARAGVSAATVSRVLNGNPQVSEATRSRVMRAADELGYRPNVMARSLARRRGIGVGMVVGDISAPHYGSLIRAAERELRGAGQMLVVASGYMRREGERDAIRFLRDQRCSALIIHAGGLDESELTELARGDMPVVVVNRHIPRIEAACLWVDHRAAGRMAARELLAHGHRRIAAITGPLRIADATDRHEGFVEELARHDVELAPGAVYNGDYCIETGDEAVRTLLGRAPGFTALFAGNDSMAIGAMQALARRGYAVPDDVSVIGYDNNDQAALVTPGLTTIDIPVAAIGRNAARMVLATLGQPVATFSHEFTPSLVRRASVTPPRDADDSAALDTR